ncbi:MAG TPA: sigma-70 family RNA polymerase sigma factor [Bryobacteraceae bacterium]|nr:sigma-70 family RNA polymerase sigma factor [Bryobacteraceae bacterium]
MLSELPRRYSSDPRLLLWVSPVDAQGIPADPMFLEAAERIGSDFTKYRARDINDPSRALEFAERAVYLASRAKKRRPIEDAVAYLFRTFTNLMDREIERTRRFVSLDDDLLRAIGRRSATEPEAEMEKAITWREALDSLDPTMRWVLWRLYWGFSVNEIAAQLGISPNTLSQRISRTRKHLRKHLKKTLDRDPSVEARSVDAPQSRRGVNSRGADSRRGLPYAGADGVRRPPQS